MFRFLHVADLHLDSPLKGLEHKDGAPVEQIRNATRRALDNLVRFAVREKVDFVVIAGDVYDGDWRDAGTGMYFVRQMSRLKEAGIPVVMIAGNHDAQNKMTQTLPLPSVVRMLPAHAPSTVRLDPWDVAIHGQSFANARVDEDLSGAYPRADRACFNIGLLHTCGPEDSYHARYAPCTLDGLRGREYHYWALGHIHQRQELCGEPPIVFPGNLQGRHPKETGAKGAVLVTVHGERSTQEFVPLDVLRWEQCVVDVSGAWNLDDVAFAFRDRLRTLVDRNDGLPLAVRITLTGASRAHRALGASGERWKHDLRAIALDEGGGQVWLERLILATQPEQAPVEMDGPVGEILAYVEELRRDPGSLQRVLEEFSDLAGKLPVELKEQLTDVQSMAELLDVVQPLLMDRLEGKAVGR